MDGGDPLSKQLKSVYQRGDPDDTVSSLTYTIRHFTYHASVIWASTEYMNRLREGVASSKGYLYFSIRIASTLFNLRVHMCNLVLRSNYRI